MVCSDQLLERKYNPALGNFFNTIDESLLARASAEALADIKNVPQASPHNFMRPDLYNNHADLHRAAAAQGQIPGFPTPPESMLDQIATSGHSAFGAATHNISDQLAMGSHASIPNIPHQMYPPPGMWAMGGMSSSAALANAAAATASHNFPLPPQTMLNGHGLNESDYDPRELERFSERFKVRRIKLGVTQCDVGKALANLKLPGVGALSQSTICRFESLTLSHNNMVALKPVLEAWLEDAERKARETGEDDPDKKRKRTSIAAPEKRSLEAYFAVQPRPSGEKIAQIAEKLDLKKNVVRVWFCNQRQKQKRMKFSSVGH